MSRAIVNPFADSVRLAGEILASNEGINSVQMARLGGWSVQHASKVLTAARKAGVADWLRRDRDAYWWPASRIADVRAKRREELRRLEAQRAERRNADYRIKQAGKRADAAGDRVLSDRPAVIRVCPGAPLPFRCRAPASVFHMGAML